MATRALPLIALMTDFGTRDWYAACMKAVMLGICPQARVVDITHDISLQDILGGAMTIAAASPWFPRDTVFACVVDPGVGTSRHLIAARADHHWFVGPDNGVFGLVFQRAKRLSLVHLTNPRYWLPTISQTFHGRDIIAPVAAHLARGRALQALGVPQARYQSLSLPPLQRTRRALRGRVVYIDTFGNLITNLPGDLLSSSVACRVRYHTTAARAVSSYAKGRRGELLALIGSSGYVELAVREGSAARRFHARRGDRVELRQE